MGVPVLISLRQGERVVPEFTLLVGHGSRDDEGNQEFLRFLELVRKAEPERQFEACFLELAEPDIPTGIETCVRQGSTRILVVPVILLAAGHVKSEIPEFIEQARGRYPEIEFIYGRNVGLHSKILDLLEERFLQTAGSLEPGERDSMAIVLLGRGSSDPDANGDLYKMARLLWERTGVMTVETCYSGITAPRLEEGVERAIRLGASRVVVVPYFLFTGVLIKRMLAHLADLQSQHPDVSMRMAPYFGLHAHMVDSVLDRANEARNQRAFMNCDFCHYRLAAL